MIPVRATQERHNVREKNSTPSGKNTVGGEVPVRQRKRAHAASGLRAEAVAHAIEAEKAAATSRRKNGEPFSA